MIFLIIQITWETFIKLTRVNDKIGFQFYSAGFTNYLQTNHDKITSKSGLNNQSEIHTECTAFTKIA